jgi:hypothetical protein
MPQPSSSVIHPSSHLCFRETTSASKRHAGHLGRTSTPTPTSAVLIRHLAIAPRREHDNNTYKRIPTLASFNCVRSFGVRQDAHIRVEFFQGDCIVPQRSACCAPCLDYSPMAIRHLKMFPNVDSFVLFLLCDILFRPQCGTTALCTE